MGCSDEVIGQSQRPVGTKVTWEHLGDRTAQVNSPRTAMISNSVITMFPKEIQRTEMKGPRTRARKDIDKPWLAPGNQAAMLGQELLLGEGRKRLQGIGSFLGLSQQPAAHVWKLLRKSASRPTRHPPVQESYNL